MNLFLMDAGNPMMEPIANRRDRILLVMATRVNAA